jgi:hypothetical protein
MTPLQPDRIEVGTRVYHPIAYEIWDAFLNGWATCAILVLGLLALSAVLR